MALSGGGANGSWEAGVIYGLVNNGNLADFGWDVLTGVSAGSINAMYMAGTEIGSEIEMAQAMSDLWGNLHSSDVWKDWKLGRVSGLTIMGGIVDNSPLLNFLQEMNAPQTEYKRKVTITAANVETGVYTEFD